MYHLVFLCPDTPDTPLHAPAQVLVVDKVTGLPAEDVDVSVTAGHRDAELHIKLARHVHHGGSAGQRQLESDTQARDNYYYS